MIFFFAHLGAPRVLQLYYIRPMFAQVDGTAVYKI
jgi:hypothetical protein